MSDINLKHYESYLKRLEHYIKANGLKLVYSKKDEDDAYIPSRNTIRISPNQSQAEEVATILHELGHFVDMLTARVRDHNALERSYRIFYSPRCSKKHADAVYRHEASAWRHGRSIASRLKIRLGRWYDTVEQECLKSYKDNHGQS